MRTVETFSPSTGSWTPDGSMLATFLPSPRPAGEDDGDVRALLASGRLRSVLQPVVDLRSQTVVAHEALLRGPADSSLESPLDLIAAARAAGVEHQLDVAALRGHLTHVATAAPGASILFVNVEPATLSADLPGVLDVLATRPPGLQVVVEITERALAADPAGVLTAAEHLRAAGCPIALDDVGAEPASLAFVPLLRPEVVKLDLRLLRDYEDLATITVAHAVRAYAEESGAQVVAEGIETPEDRARAMVLGASLGQGWLWGAAVALPRRAWAPRSLLPAADAPRRRSGLTPFALLGPEAATTAPKGLLLAVSRGIELVAEESRVPPVLLSCFQDARNVGPGTARRYAALAQRLPLVGAFGAGMPTDPAPGVRGVALPSGDVLREEWSVVVLGAHDAVALLARERPTPPGERDGRWFDFAVTHDRARVTEAALRLIERLGVTG